MNLTSARSLLKESLLSYINSKEAGRPLVVGENVNVGSHISGLADAIKDLGGQQRVIIVNSPNTETVTLGACFGWSNRTQSPAFLFVKQLDFITLYIDDLLSTRNVFDSLGYHYNINIITFLVDNSTEGPPSCLRRVQSLSRFLRVDFYPITYVSSANCLVERLASKGLKVFVCSQSHFNKGIDSNFQVTRDYPNADSSFYGFEVYDSSFMTNFSPAVCDSFFDC